MSVHHSLDRTKFLFMLMTYIDNAIDTEWHSNQYHQGKVSMDVVGGTIKKLVFRKKKSGNIITDLPKEYVDYASQLVTSITSLYLPVEEIIEELEEITRAPAIPGNLKIYKVIRNYNSRNICYLEFFTLSDQSIPAFKQFYRKDDDPAISDHQDVDVDSNTSAYWLKPYWTLETQERLGCLGCCKWFHESCFHV